MDDWEIVRAVTTEEEAVIVAGFLRANGIPAEVESLAISELPVTLGNDMGEVRILVPADRLSEAMTLLAERDAADSGNAGNAGDTAPSAPEPGSAPAEPGQPQAELSPVEPE